MTQLKKTRSAVFWTHVTFHEDENGSWDIGDQDKPLDEQINSWLEKKNVQAYFISPPQVNMLGRDDNKNIHMTVGVSILYLPGDNLRDDEQPAFESGGLGDILRQFKSQLPDGVDLSKVIRVVTDDETKRALEESAKRGEQSSSG